MLKSRIIFLITALIIAILPAGQFSVCADTNAQNVSVKIPNFKVQLNGEMMNNDYSQYPLIVYNDITYFPMTYHNCRFLGLETKWAPQKPLEIEKKNVSAAYYFYGQNKKNKTTYTASISNDFVSINGHNIDKEDVRKYPLLKFRNVRYFPLTWKYAVDNFGWKYEYTPEKGLVIESDNKRVNSIAKIDNYDDSLSDIVYHNGYVYYRNKKGDSIMRAPANNLKQAVKVFKIPINHYTDRPENPTLEVKDDGKVHMMFRAGGGFMGRDCEYYFDNNGKPVDISDDVYVTKLSDDVYVKIDKQVPPSAGNLSIKTKGDTAYRKIGDPHYCYGWHNSETKKAFENRHHAFGPNQVTLFNDSIYIAAYSAHPSESSAVDSDKLIAIYKINIKTNEIEKIDSPTTPGFARYGDFIYYIKPDGAYRLSLADDSKSAWDVDYKNFGHTYTVFGGKTYSKLTTEKEAGGFKEFNIGDSKYLACTFVESSEFGRATKGLVIFDINGHEVFRTDEMVAISSMSIENGNLYYYSGTAKCLCKVKL